MDVYEEACDRYLDDLYRIAFLALGDSDRAAQTVETVCKAGVHACRICTDVNGIRLYLIGDLYRRCRGHQSPAAASLPEPLCLLSCDDRLLLALRTVFSLTDAELAAVTNI